MRAMVIGDMASGKSSFAIELGTILDVPVIHVDAIKHELGRENRTDVGDRLRQEADQPSWIIDGNGFIDDPDYRIQKAEQLFIFDRGPLAALGSQVARYARFRSGVETPIGGVDDILNLSYSLNYCFKRSPRQKRTAIELATSQSKDIVTFKRRNESSAYLASLIVPSF